MSDTETGANITINTDGTDDVVPEEEVSKEVREPIRTQDPKDPQASPEDEGEKTTGFGLRKLVKQADQFKWEMPLELAEHFMVHTRTHVTDADMKLNMEEFPVPSNIDCVLTLDNTVRNLLKKDNKSAVVDQDSDWMTVQQKLQDVMGPLGAAWTQCAMFKKGDVENVDVYSLAETLELSVLSLAHVVQKISWFRRVHSLAALGTIKNARETLKDEKIQEIFEKDTSNSLIPKEFDDQLEKGTRKHLVKHFKPDAKDAKKKKTDSSSTTTKFKDRRFVNQRPPFPSSPSKRGGGNSGSYYGKNPFTRYSDGGRRGQGKHARAQGLHAFISRLAVSSKTCSSKFEKPISSKGSSGSTGWKNSEVLSQLEVTNQRPRDSEYSEGLGDTITGHSDSNQNSSRHKDEQSRGTGNGQGDRKHVGQGCHQGSHPQEGSIPKQCICDPKRGGTVPPHNQPEGVERVCSLPSLQDGGSERCKTSFETGGLDVQDRPEGRIFFSSPGHSLTKAGPIQLERKAVRIPLPSLRLRPCTKDIHKDDEGPNSSVKEAGNSSSDIPRRHVDYGVLTGTSDQSKGYNHVPVLPPRPDNKHEKVSLVPFPGAGIFGSSGQQPDHGLLPVQGKETKIDFEVSGSVSNSHAVPEIPMFSNRETLVHSSSRHPSSTSAQISTTIVHKSASSKTALRDNDHAFFRRHFGTEMVDRKPESHAGKPNASTTTRVDHLLRRSKDRGLGGSLPSWINGRNVVRGGEDAPYKHSRAYGSRTSHKDFHQGPHSKIHTHENRQHNSIVLSNQHGRDQESTLADYCQKDMGIPVESWDHNYCGMDPITSQRGSRLGVQKCVGLGRMETISSDVPISLPNDGSTRDRPICIEDISPGPKLLQLEDGSKLPGSGCLSTGLDAGLSLCIPPLLPHHKGATTSGITEGEENDPHNPSLANPTMVPASHGHVGSSAHHASHVQTPAVEPIGLGPPATSKLLSKAGGLASVRKRLRDAGVSDGASGLIINSRREGTSQTYESAWKKWSLWCGGRGLDPITCPVNHILEYLSHLFSSGTPYRTIAGHRSAISAYHVPIVVDSTLVTAGRHPLVSALMSGVHNLRPPQAKYSFTWDIEVVLCLFKSWPLDPTPKQLTQKVTTLLALIGVPRGAELHLFDLNYMADFGNKLVFELPGTVKNVREGLKPKPLEFHKHEQDEKLCPVTCIRRYITLTEAWRTEGVPSAFFLSFKNPHKPVTKSTLARWIKDVLLLAEVDNVFSAHSLRGASTSKALLKGLTVKEVVDHGKWSLESTWQRFYHKEVVSASKKYQDGILKL